MNTSPATATDQHVDQWVLRRVELDAIIARANEEKQLLNGHLIEKLGLGTHEHAHARITISRRGALDAAKLEAAFNPEQYPQLYVQKLSTDAVKKNFAPAALEQYKSYSAPSVTIK